MRAWVDGGRSTGIAAGMLLGDGRMHVVAHGDAGRERPIDEHSVFEIGSITKVFTATLLAQMEQCGELALTDAVTTLLGPDASLPSRNGRQITLLDLATQTSGLPRLPDNLVPADESNPYADYAVEDMYGFLAGYTLPRDPGAKYEYSNLGVGLLGHALALRGQASYEELLRERVLQPLGLTSTAITLSGRAARDLACGHDAAGEAVAHWDLPTLAGAGALRSTIGDLLRFAQANLSDASGPLRAAMALTHVPRKRVALVTRIGLNWHILGYRANTLLMHDGMTGGFSSCIVLHPARRTAVVVLANASGEGVTELGLHLLNERMRLPAPPQQRTAVSLPADVLECYVGAYDLAGTPVVVTRVADGLNAHVAGAGNSRLLAESETAFFVKGIDAQVVFKLAKAGEVTGAVLHQAGKRIKISKVG